MALISVAKASPTATEAITLHDNAEPDRDGGTMIFFSISSALRYARPFQPLIFVGLETLFRLFTLLGGLFENFNS